jgi:hypothetical protein
MRYVVRDSSQCVSRKPLVGVGGPAENCDHSTTWANNIGQVRLAERDSGQAGGSVGRRV